MELNSDRIDDRERRRRRKLRDEERRDLQIQRAEDGKWGRSKNKAIVHLNSPTDFPAFSPPAEWQDPSAFSMPGPDGLTLAEGSVLETHGTGANDPGPSFAQVWSIDFTNSRRVFKSTEWISIFFSLLVSRCFVEVKLRLRLVGQ